MKVFEVAEHESLVRIVKFNGTNPTQPHVNVMNTKINFSPCIKYLLYSWFSLSTSFTYNLQEFRDIRNPDYY